MKHAVPAEAGSVSSTARSAGPERGALQASGPHLRSPPAGAPEGEVAVTERTRLRRHPERGTQARAAIWAILDEALVCHVGLSFGGSPRVLPTAHVRVGDELYLHGARGNRLLSEAASGAALCVEATLLDGLIFGSSWLRHSMNFRSVVVFGEGAEVHDRREKLVALAALVDKAAPGRSREARAPTEEELRATLLVRVPLREASVKARTGPPGGEASREETACWTGELPLRLAPLPPRSGRSPDSAVAVSPAVGARSTALGLDARQPFERSRGELVISTDPSRVDFAFVHRFLAEDSYWAAGIDAERQRLAHSQSLAFGLYRGTEQLGFARVLTDYGRLAYLGDVFIAAHARGRGLGRWLVASVLEHPDLAAVERWLLGTADAHGLYERFGFAPAPEGRYMLRRRAS